MRALEISSCERAVLYVLFSKKTKQLALRNILCNVYKMIITPKKCQQELSTSSTNHLQSGTLTQWCQNTFPFSLEQSYYFILTNEGERKEKSTLKTTEKLQICKETRVAGELTQLLGVKLDFLGKSLEGKGCLTEQRLRDYPKGSYPHQHKSMTRQRNPDDSNQRQIIIPPMKWKTFYAPVNCPFSIPWQANGTEKKKLFSHGSKKGRCKITERSMLR